MPDQTTEEAIKLLKAALPHIGQLPFGVESFKLYGKIEALIERVEADKD